MDRLRWVFELFDKMSGPSKRISTSLGDLDKRLAGARKGTMDAGGAADFARDRFLKWGMGLGGWMSVANGVKDVLSQIASVTVESGLAFAKLGVNMLGFREQTMKSFELMLGSQTAAKGLYDQALAFAKLTPFETEDVVTGFKQLMGAGFKREDVGTIFAGLGDVAAAAGFDKSVVSGLTLQLAQVKALGKLQMVDLRVMSTQLAQAGAGIGEVYAKIAANMGIGVEQVAEAMQRGEISADVGILSIMQAIQTNTSKGALGNLSLTLSDTIPGLFSRLQSVAADFFLAWEKGLDSPGIKTFKGALINLLSIFDMSTDTGRRFQAIVTDAFDALMAPLAQFSGPGGAGKLADLFEGLAVIVTGLWDVFVAFATTLWDTVSPMVTMFGMLGKGNAGFRGWAFLLKVIAFSIGILVNGFLVLGMLVGLFFTGVSDTLEYIYNTFRQGGSDIITGLIDGITAGAGALWDTVKGIGAGIKSTFSGALRFGSPSKVFEQYGQFTTQGYTRGLEGGLAGVETGVTAMASTAAGSGTGRSSRSTGTTVALTIQIDNTGHQDGDAIAARLAELLPSQVAGLFDQLAVEIGA